MTGSFDVLIVGAGHGSDRASPAAFAGSIALFGEPELLYERPPLSKDYLAGEKAFDRMLIRPAAFWDEREVTMLTGKRVSAVDLVAHSVTLSTGETMAMALPSVFAIGDCAAHANPFANGDASPVVGAERQ